MNIPDYLKADDWTVNSAGLRFSRFFSFGLMDAGAMTRLAKQWKTVPPQEHCSVEESELNEDISSDSERSFETDISDCLGLVNYIEQVQLQVKNYYKYIN